MISRNFCDKSKFSLTEKNFVKSQLFINFFIEQSYFHEFFVKNSVILTLHRTLCELISRNIFTLSKISYFTFYFFVWKNCMIVECNFGLTGKSLKWRFEIDFTNFYVNCAHQSKTTNYKMDYATYLWEILFDYCSSGNWSIVWTTRYKRS